MKTLALATILALGLLAAPLAAEAQQAGKVWRVGFLGPGTPTSWAPGIDALRLGLRDHGYVEGRNITIEYRGRRTGTTASGACG